MLTKKCIVCGKEFIKPESCGLPEWFGCERRPLGRRFCSKNCKAKYTYNDNLKKHQFSKERHYIPPTAYKKGEHPSSKTEFKKGLTPWNKDRPWTVEERKKIADGLPERWGELAGNWKGGITKLGAAIRTMSLYIAWRTFCFIRDNHICQKCGARTKKGVKVYLQCHHLKPFYQILIDNNVKTIEEAKNCKELWDTNNGQTLCIPCHKQTDSYLMNQYRKEYLSSR